MSENAYHATRVLALCREEHIIYTPEGERIEAGMKPEAQAEILQRLRTADGHLKGVIDMTEAGRSCEEVLYQLNALQVALRAVSIQMILCQIRSSQAEILENSSPGRRTAELKRLRSFCSLFMHYSNHPNEVINE